VTWVGWYAFTNNLISDLTLGTGVTAISNYSFYNNQLVSLNIPINVTEIYAEAFGANTTLTEIIMEGRSDATGMTLETNWNNGVTPTYQP